MRLLSIGADVVCESTGGFARCLRGPVQARWRAIETEGANGSDREVLGDERALSAHGDSTCRTHLMVTRIRPSFSHRAGRCARCVATRGTAGSFPVGASGCRDAIASQDENILVWRGPASPSRQHSRRRFSAHSCSPSRRTHTLPRAARRRSRRGRRRHSGRRKTDDLSPCPPKRLR